MKIIKSIKSLLYGLYNSIKRFPITISLTTAIAIILIIVREMSPSLSQVDLDNLTRLAMVLAVGIPLSLCIKLAFENSPKISSKLVLIYKVISYILAAVVLILYYLFLLPDFKMVPTSRFFAINIALYLGFFFIPFTKKRQNFELYVIKVLSGFLLTIIYSAVLFGGLSAIMFTLDKLLSVPIKSKYYYYLWLIIAGVFAPSYFLGGLPTINQKFSKSNYSKALKILLLYIVMPIITVYTTILYIYFAKIIITLQWPVGLVSHLVLWFSVVSIGIIFLISPLSDENKWVKTFIFWFTKLIIPILIMMFAAIGIRIKAYGITENRYYVIVLGLWVISMMIYLNFTKGKKNIVLPISLAIISILSVTGPWSSYSIAKLSQNNRLENILLSNEMLKDDVIVKKEADLLLDKDKNEISQIIQYFQRNHNLSDIRYLPKDFVIDDMKDVFGFPFQYNDYYNNKRNKYFSYNTYNSVKLIDISGYDYFIDYRNFYGKNQPPILSDNISFKYDASTLKFEVLSGDNILYSKHISDYGQPIFDKYGIVDKADINPEDMQFVEETDKLKLKFIIFDIYGETSSSDESKVNVNSVNFSVMVKIK